MGTTDETPPACCPQRWPRCRGEGTAAGLLHHRASRRKGPSGSLPLLYPSVCATHTAGSLTPDPPPRPKPPR